MNKVYLLDCTLRDGAIWGGDHSRLQPENRPDRY